MNYNPKSLRPFIGAKNYQQSRKFYTDLGFEEHVIDASMSLFKVNEQLAFYLQNAYVQDWIDNTMVFLEVEDVDLCRAELLAKNLPQTYENVRLSGIAGADWGREIFMHDPSGILWHFGEFSK